MKIRKNTILLTLFFGILIYMIGFYIGFGEGQASVYEKARNDIEFRKEVWGIDN
ncbi:MAG: hypothetical protein ABS939_03690 [Psychrobacillus sp.]